MTLEVYSRQDAIDVVDAIPLALPVSVVLTDLDGFGELNERLGSDAGEAVLRGFADALVQNTPDDAAALRIGGDEWAVVLPGRTVESSLVLMEELRSHLEAVALPDVGEPVRMSAGVAGRPPHGNTGEELLRAADEALMRGKRSGRNQVVIHVEDKMVLKSNYYSRATLDRLAALSRATNRTEASLLREAADKLLTEYAERI
ncbi:MAG: GGDEF domain-containing protein [Actinomycetota bacterium]